MIILQTTTFRKAIKKLHANQKTELDKAIKILIADPPCGEAKVGDLAGVRVYKFAMLKTLTLIAYALDDKEEVLTLLALGAHENFYRDLKKSS